MAQEAPHHRARRVCCALLCACKVAVLTLRVLPYFFAQTFVLLITVPLGDVFELGQGFLEEPSQGFLVLNDRVVFFVIWAIFSGVLWLNLLIGECLCLSARGVYSTVCLRLQL